MDCALHAAWRPLPRMAAVGSMGDLKMSSPNELTHRPRASSAEWTPTWMGALLRVLLATIVALAATRLINNVLAGEPLIPQPDVAGVSQVNHVLLWLLSSLLIFGALSYSASLSSLRGVGLVQAIAVALFGLRYLLTFAEAAVFLPSMSLSDAAALVFGGAIESVTFAVCIAVAVGKATAQADQGPAATFAMSMPVLGWAWRWGLCMVAYLCLYLAAGLSVFPFVKQYYPDLDVNFAFLCGLQIRRGFIFVACLLPLVRSIRASRRRTALATAVLVPIVAGVADLLVPNAIMPATAWRVAHMIEVGSSNFVFGLLIGYLFHNGYRDTPT